MAIEVAEADAELSSYLEVLAEIDTLQGQIRAKLSALDSILASVPEQRRSAELISCLRAGCVVRDRLRLATETPGTFPEPVPSLDTLLLEAIRGAYRWSIEGLDRACRLTDGHSPSVDEGAGPAPTVFPVAQLRELCAEVRDAPHAVALSDALASVIEAIGALAGAIERIERTSAHAQA